MSIGNKNVSNAHHCNYLQKYALRSCFASSNQSNKTMQIKFLAMTLVVFAASCGTNQSPNSEEGKNSNQNAQTVSHKETEVVDNQSQKKESKYMYELAINQSKEGQHQNFLDTRAKFVEVLGNQEETLNEGKWNPFFTVAPDLNLDNILIGMAHWNSMEGFVDVKRAPISLIVPT